MTQEREVDRVLETAPQDKLESAVGSSCRVVHQLGLASHRALADHLGVLSEIPLVHVPGTF